MANLRDSNGKEKMSDYLHKKSLGKKNRQPDDKAEITGSPKGTKGK